MTQNVIRAGGPILLAAVLAGGIFSAGCGGGSDSASTAATKPAGGAATTAATAASAASPAATTAATSAGGSAASLGAKFTGSIPTGAPTVDQKDQLFKPDKLTVKLGDTVYFTNSEAAVHSVNVDGKNILGVGALMKEREIATWKPAKAGTFAITCDYHPAMKLAITVQ